MRGVPVFSSNAERNRFYSERNAKAARSRERARQVRAAAAGAVGGHSPAEILARIRARSEGADVSVGRVSPPEVGAAE